MKNKNNKNNETEEALELIVNPQLPPVWVDEINPFTRGDGITLIRLVANLPEGAIEQAKFMLNEETIKEFVDSVSFALNYYPKKTELKKKYEVEKKGAVKNKKIKPA